VAGSDRRFAAQLEWLRSDERLRRQVAGANETTPEERLRAAHALCAAAAKIAAQQPASLRARLEAAREPISASAAAALRKLSRG
jgi:hypothetical protein